MLRGISEPAVMLLKENLGSEERHRTVDEA